MFYCIGTEKAYFLNWSKNLGVRCLSEGSPWRNTLGRKVFLIQKKNCRCFIKKDNIVECKLFFSHRQVIHNCCRQDFFDTTIIVFSWANPTFGICLDAESAVILFLVSIFLAHYFLMWKYKLCKRKNRRALQNYPPSDSEGGLSKVSKIVGEYCYYHHWHLGLILFWKFKIFQTRPNN